MPVLSPDPIISVRPEDAQAVHTLLQRLTDAWNAADAASVAEVFAEDADILVPGAALKGRAVIVDWLIEAYRTKWKGLRVLSQMLQLRYAGDDTMVMVAHGGPYDPEGAEIPGHFAIRGIWVFSRTGGEWLVHAYCNTPVGDSIVLPPAHV